MTAARRQAERSYAQRRRERGDRRVAVWMTPQTMAAIAAIKSLTPDEPQTTEDVIADAVAQWAGSIIKL